jgi:hypothetical protein
MISANKMVGALENASTMAQKSKRIWSSKYKACVPFQYLSEFAVVFARDVKLLAFGRAVKRPCKGFVPFG